MKKIPKWDKMLNPSDSTKEWKIWVTMFNYCLFQNRSCLKRLILFLSMSSSKVSKAFLESNTNSSAGQTSSITPDTMQDTFWVPQGTGWEAFTPTPSSLASAPSWSCSLFPPHSAWSQHSEEERERGRKHLLCPLEWMRDRQYLQSLQGQMKCTGAKR